MTSMTCGRCGFANSATARFCGRCGASLQPVAQPASAAPPIACPRCSFVNAAGARFCGRCGQALAAAVPIIAYPRADIAQVQQATSHKTGKGLPWTSLVAVLGLAAAGLAAAANLSMQQAAKTCTVTCPPPPPPHPPVPPLGPAGPPLPAPTSYTDPTYGYSFAYPNFLGAPTANGQVVGWTGTLTTDNSSWQIVVQGKAANGQTPQQIVQALQQSSLSGAAVVFNITGAELGSIAGYGTVYDVTISPQGGQQQHDRVVIEAAIRGTTAIAMIAESEFTPDKNEHPSPAQLDPTIEQVADMVGNSITWQGEPQI